MATKNKVEMPKIKDVIGLRWEKVPESPSDTCDFCGAPLYSDGWWNAYSSVQKTGNKWRSTDVVYKACKRCALDAGLEW